MILPREFYGKPRPRRCLCGRPDCPDTRPADRPTTGQLVEAACGLASLLVIFLLLGLWLAGLWSMRP